MTHHSCNNITACQNSNNKRHKQWSFNLSTRLIWIAFVISSLCAQQSIASLAGHLLFPREEISLPNNREKLFPPYLADLTSHPTVKVLRQNKNLQPDPAPCLLKNKNLILIVDDDYSSTDVQLEPFLWLGQSVRVMAIPASLHHQSTGDPFIPDRKGALPVRHRVNKVPSHPCKPGLQKYTHPYPVDVYEANRFPVVDGFVWLFFETGRYVSIYADPEQPPSSVPIIQEPLQPGCPLIAIISQERVALFSHCEAPPNQSGIDKPNTIMESSLVTLTQNPDGSWTVSIHMPDGTVKTLSEEEYKRLRSLNWELMIAQLFGETPNFVDAPHWNYFERPSKRRIKIPLHPVKTKGDKLDGQEATEGNVYPSGDGAARGFNEQSPTDSPLPSRKNKKKSNKGQPSSSPSDSPSEHSLPENKISSAPYWAADFLRQAAGRTNMHDNIKVVVKFAKDNDVTETLQEAAESLLQSTAPQLFKENSSLDSLLADVLSISSWAELLTKSKLVEDEASLAKLYKQKINTMRKTPRKNMLREKPKPVQAGWNATPDSSVNDLEQKISSTIESSGQPVDSRLSDTLRDFQSTELLFHDTSMTSGFVGRKYLILDSADSLTRIRQTCQTHSSGVPEQINHRVIDESLQFLHFDQPAAETFIRRIVEQLPDIQNLIREELSSTFEQAGILEQSHLLGWFSEGGTRLGITVIPQVDFSQLRITRFNDNNAIIEVDIRVPSAERVMSFSMPDKIKIPTKETIELPIKGQLRIAISTNNNQPAIHGGSLVFEELELTDEAIRQQREGLASQWHNAGNELPDGNLQTFIRVLESFTQTQMNHSTSINEANLIISSTTRAFNKIDELKQHQHTLSPALIRKLIEDAEEAVLNQWNRIQSFMTQVFKLDGQLRSESYKELLPHYQAVSDAALEILKRSHPNPENSQQAAAAALSIIQNRQTLREKTEATRVTDGAAARIKEKPEFAIDDNEHDRLMLMLTYGALTERHALNQLDRDFQSLVSQYPALEPFQLIGTEHKPESPVDLEQQINEALESGEHPTEQPPEQDQQES